MLILGKFTEDHLTENKGKRKAKFFIRNAPTRKVCSEHRVEENSFQRNSSIILRQKENYMTSKTCLSSRDRPLASCHFPFFLSFGYTFFFFLYSEKRMLNFAKRVISILVRVKVLCNTSYYADVLGLS